MPHEPQLDTLLLVDDEESVRRTFHEWLDNAHLGCQILTAADAEAALVLANQHTIDLAILDWNLGAGNDGLQLLEDLVVFNPEIVAILVTGYAHQATPLHAMRMGVRDYLDKNQDLNRQAFLNAVQRQLDRLRPAKRERRLHQNLAAFRAAVEKVLPLVQSAAALNDPVPLPQAVRSLFQFLLTTTQAAAGVLLVRSYEANREPAEVCRVYGADGKRLDVELVPFALSVAGAAASMQETCMMKRLDDAAAQGIVLQPFERGRRTLLAAPLPVAAGVQVILELFDKPGADFTVEDARVVTAAAAFGTELLRQALAERQTHALLFEAIEAALGASEHVTASLRSAAAPRQDDPPPELVLDQMRETLRTHPTAAAAPADTLQLAEAIRVLALRHGPAAVQHCTRLVESVRQLLDNVV